MKMHPGQEHRGSSLEPYLHQQYNVKMYTSDDKFNRDSSIARIFNALVKVLNDNTRIPRFILIIPGRVLFKAISYNGFGISMIMGGCIDWLLANMERVICTKNMDIQQLRTGAVNYFEPKVIWAKMVPEGIHIREPSLALVQKFNAILEQSLFQSKMGYIMRVLENNQLDMWDRNGRLTHDGRIAYWKQISAMLKRFDNQQDNKELEPRNIFHTANPRPSLNNSTAAQSTTQCHRKY